MTNRRDMCSSSRRGKIIQDSSTTSRCVTAPPNYSVTDTHNLCRLTLSTVMAADEIRLITAPPFVRSLALAHSPLILSGSCESRPYLRRPRFMYASSSALFRKVAQYGTNDQVTAKLLSFRELCALHTTTVQVLLQRVR